MTTPTQSEALLPCPFCGGDAIFYPSRYDASDNDPIRDYVRVECTSGCVAQDDIEIGTRSWGKPNWSKADKASAEQKATWRWNRRATIADEPAQPTDNEEALELLNLIFDAWENGDPMYEEGDGGYLGSAFKLDDDVFERACDLLNRRNPPRNAPCAPILNPISDAEAIRIAAESGVFCTMPQAVEFARQVRGIDAHAVPQEPMTWIDTVRSMIFYADPGFYHACSFAFNRPTGGFDEDFDYAEEYERAMPGKLARQTLDDFAKTLPAETGIDIDDFIVDLEKDPENKVGFSEARKWLRDGLNQEARNEALEDAATECERALLLQQHARYTGSTETGMQTSINLVRGLKSSQSKIKWHVIAQVVNELRDIAINYHDAQQLRERIAHCIVPYLNGEK